MKISLRWLQTYFDAPLPSAAEIADAYTFHAFEIEETQGDLMDVKVLPNRSADCLSHRGLASELSAILDIPMKKDPLREPLPEFPKTSELVVSVEDGKKCPRYMGALVKGVKVGPSPAWLREALEAVGQRSINNVVDAANYVMLNIGQPLHAFDAGKLVGKEGRYALGVRGAREGEKITVLTGEDYTLPEGTLLITDAQRDVAAGIAGIKGGKLAEVSFDTTDLLIEAATFDGAVIRRATQAIKLSTDASVRFQNRPSPRLVAYGMRDLLALISEIAGGDVAGVVDIYPDQPSTTPVSVTLARINGLLGSRFVSSEVADVFRRLRLETKIEGDEFVVTPPFERTDISRAEDLVEEVGRIVGYDTVVAAELPASEKAPDQSRYRGIERMKDQLIEQGFTEVSTQSFAKKGDVVLANPLDKARPALRVSLAENLEEALARAKNYAPLVLAPGEKPKLFEVGSVFPKEGEYMELRLTEKVPEWGEQSSLVDNLSAAKLEGYGESYVPEQQTLGAYQPFSVYPFIVRDIAVWVPSGVDEEVTKSLIAEKAGELLKRIDPFDRFEKEGRVSLAFRLVFQSKERTLTDEEVQTRMDAVTAALSGAGYEVR